MGVNLHVDLETLQLIQGPGQRNAFASLRFKRGDAALLRVVFLENGITPVTIGNPSELEIQIGIKPRNQFDQPFIAQSSIWTMPVAGDETPTYECELSLNTLEINTALNIGSATADELPEITLMGEITFREGTGEPTSTRTFIVVVENDVNRGTEGIPIEANPAYPAPANIEILANKGIANGYAPLNADGKVPATHITLTTGAAGPNTITTATTTPLVGFLKGNGTTVVASNNELVPNSRLESDYIQDYPIGISYMPVDVQHWPSLLLQGQEAVVVTERIPDGYDNFTGSQQVYIINAGIESFPQGKFLLGYRSGTEDEWEEFNTAPHPTGTNTGDQFKSVTSQRLIGRFQSGTGAAQEVQVGGGIEFQGGVIRRSILTGAVAAAAGSNVTTLTNNISGTKSFTSTVRPTSSGTGTPEPTSLITAADLASSTFVSVRDEFIGGGTAGNVIGELGWQRFISPSSAAAGGNVILASGTLPHIGLRTLISPNVVNSGTVIFLPSITNILDGSKWEMTFVVRLNQTTNCDMIVGVTKDIAAAGVGKFGGVSFGCRYSSAHDNDFMFYAKNSNNDFEANDANNFALSSGVAVNTGFNTFRIRSTALGFISMSINGGPFVFAETNFINLSPAFVFVYIAPREAVNKTATIDFFSFRSQTNRQ